MHTVCRCKRDIECIESNENATWVNYETMQFDSSCLTVNSLRRCVLSNVAARFFRSNFDYIIHRRIMLRSLTRLFPSGISSRQFALILPQSRLNSTLTASTSPVSASIAIETENNSDQSQEDKLYKRLEVELRGCDPAVLNSYTVFATTAAKHLDIELGRCWAPRKAEKKRWTVLKSAFVHKKHRVQYEVRTYFKFMHFHRLTGSTLSTFLEYIERNLPEGIALKTTKVEILRMPDHLKQPPPEAKDAKAVTEA